MSTDIVIKKEVATLREIIIIPALNGFTVKFIYRGHCGHVEARHVVTTPQEIADLIHSEPIEMEAEFTNGYGDF